MESSLCRPSHHRSMVFKMFHRPPYIVFHFSNGKFWRLNSLKAFPESQHWFVAMSSGCQAVASKCFSSDTLPALLCCLIMGYYHGKCTMFRWHSVAESACTLGAQDIEPGDHKMQSEFQMVKLFINEGRIMWWATSTVKLCYFQIWKPSFLKNLFSEPDTAYYMVNLKSLWSGLEASILLGRNSTFLPMQSKRKVKAKTSVRPAHSSLCFWCVVHSNAHASWCPPEHHSTRAVLP